MMKKLFALFILICTLMTSSSCEMLNSRSKLDLDLEVVYFYGFFEEYITNDYIARSLFDYNYIQFDIEEPDKFLIPGDVFYLEVIGNIFVAESFPGQMYLDKGSNITKQKYYYTQVVEVNEEDILRDSKGYILDVKYYNSDDKFIILNEDLSFIELSKFNGDKIYASLYLDENMEIISNEYACLFAYNVR